MNAPHYTGFWRRFNAYGIDATIVMLIAWMLDAFITPAFAQGLSDADQLQAQLAQIQQLVTALQTGQITPEMMALVKQSLMDSMLGGSIIGPDKYMMIAVSALYNILFVISPWRATPGKRILGMEVVHRDGTPLTLMQSAARHTLSGLSMLPLGLGCVTIAFTREKTAPHDMFCATRVVRTNWEK